MLKKINRLSVLRASGKKQEYGTPLFKLKIFEGGEKDRFGFVVSKKIDKRAVIRNKTKRVYKKAIREFLPQIKQSGSMIFIARSKLDFTQSDKLSSLIKNVFQKAKVLK